MKNWILYCSNQCNNLFDKLVDLMINYHRHLCLEFSPSHFRWILLSNSSEGVPVGIFKCGSRKEEYLGSVTIQFFHKRYILRYLICITIHITIRVIGNCNYSLKSMLVDMMLIFFLKSSVFVELPFSSYGDHLINILGKVNRLIYTFKIN
jgi:hypothetical protein